MSRIEVDIEFDGPSGGAAEEWPGGGIVSGRAVVRAERETVPKFVSIRQIALLPLLLFVAAFLIFAAVFFSVIMGILWAGRALRRLGSTAALGRVELELGCERAFEAPAFSFEDRLGKLAPLLRALKQNFSDLSSRDYLVSPGQLVPVTIAFTPRRATQIEAVEARFVVTESSTGSHTDGERQVWSEVALDETVQISGAREYRRGLPAVIGAELRLPRGSIFTLKKAGQEISWRVELRIRVRGALDWVQAHTLTVVPSE